MRQLLIKEFKLTACPLTFVFLLFAVLVMAPGYPILVNVYFMCLGMLYTFQFAREDNDVLYTALLPVSKADVVRARVAFVVTIEVIGFVLCLILTLVRMAVMSDVKPYVTNPLMSANFVYLGGVLVVFALYNLIFVNGFFKTAHFFGKPFIWFTVVAFIFIGVMETLHNIPGLEMLNTRGFEYMGLQIGALAAGVVIYVIGTVYTLKRSMRNFEKIDL